MAGRLYDGGGVVALSASALIVGAIVFLLLLFSGLLFRIFRNVLLTAAIMTLSVWVAILLIGFVIFVGTPIYCGLSGKSLEELVPQALSNESKMMRH